MIKNEKKISCIVPAYNEGKRIEAVLRVLTTHDLVDEVIVVEDGSSDNTLEVILGFNQKDKIKLIRHEVNKGKSVSLHDGIRASSHDHIMFIDSDLVGLTHEDITSLILPIANNVSEVSISLRKNSPKFWHRIGLDYISGERVIPKKMILPHLDKMLSLRPFGIEVFFNSLIIENNHKIKVVKWPGVISPFKVSKNGLYKGIKGDISMMLDIFRTISLFGPIFQIIKMRRLIQHELIKNLKFSLIVCAYNEEKYIGECLDFAIKNSNGLLHEIIVVNNASTDNTKQVVESFAGVKVVDENKKGQVVARQKGYTVSSGDVLIYLDADTRMPKNWMNILISELNSNPNLVCLSGPYVYHDTSKFHQLLIKIYWYFFAHPMYLIVGYMAVGGNIVIKKDVVDKMGGFDTSIKFYGEDTDIARRASKFGKVKFKQGFYMHTSARRLAGQGIFSTAFTYMANYLSVVILAKPVTSEYKDIR